MAGIAPERHQTGRAIQSQDHGRHIPLVDQVSVNVYQGAEAEGKPGYSVYASRNVNWIAGG